MFKVFWTNAAYILLVSLSLQTHAQQQSTQLTFEVDLANLQDQIKDGTAPKTFDFLANQQHHRVNFLNYLKCIPYSVKATTYVDGELVDWGAKLRFNMTWPVEWFRKLGPTVKALPSIMMVREIY